MDSSYSKNYWRRKTPEEIEEELKNNPDEDPYPFVIEDSDNVWTTVQGLNNDTRISIDNIKKYLSLLEEEVNNKTNFVRYLNKILIEITYLSNTIYNPKNKERQNTDFGNQIKKINNLIERNEDKIKSESDRTQFLNNLGIEMKRLISMIESDLNPRGGKRRTRRRKSQKKRRRHSLRR